MQHGGIPLYCGDFIFFRKPLEIVIEVFIAEFDFAEVVVCLEHVVGSLDDGDGNIGAMVGHTLIIVQDIGKHKTSFDGTCAFLETFDMICLDVPGEIVNDLFQRFYIF